MSGQGESDSHLQASSSSRPPPSQPHADDGVVAVGDSRQSIGPSEPQDLDAFVMEGGHVSQTMTEQSSKQLLETSESVGTAQNVGTVESDQGSHSQQQATTQQDQATETTSLGDGSGAHDDGNSTTTSEDGGSEYYDETEVLEEGDDIDGESILSLPLESLNQLPARRRRAKLYILEQANTWNDRGTGLVSITIEPEDLTSSEAEPEDDIIGVSAGDLDSYLRREVTTNATTTLGDAGSTESAPSSLIITVMSEDSDEIIIRHKVAWSADRESKFRYGRQRRTIITWQDKQDNRVLRALSFLDSYFAARLWQEIENRCFDQGEVPVGTEEEEAGDETLQDGESNQEGFAVEGGSTDLYHVSSSDQRAGLSDDEVDELEYDEVAESHRLDSFHGYDSESRHDYEVVGEEDEHHEEEDDDVLAFGTELTQAMFGSFVRRAGFGGVVRQYSIPELLGLDVDRDKDDVDEEDKKLDFKKLELSERSLDVVIEQYYTQIEVRDAYTRFFNSVDGCSYLDALLKFGAQAEADGNIRLCIKVAEIVRCILLSLDLTCVGHVLESATRVMNIIAALEYDLNGAEPPIETHDSDRFSSQMKLRSENQSGTQPVGEDSGIRGLKRKRVDDDGSGEWTATDDDTDGEDDEEDEESETSRSTLGAGKQDAATDDEDPLSASLLGSKRGRSRASSIRAEDTSQSNSYIENEDDQVTTETESFADDDHEPSVLETIERSPLHPPEFYYRHRRWLARTQFKNLINIVDQEVIYHIHLNFRITYLRDVLLLRYLDDAFTAALNTVTCYNDCRIFAKLGRPSFIREKLLQLAKLACYNPSQAGRPADVQISRPFISALPAYVYKIEPTEQIKIALRSGETPSSLQLLAKKFSALRLGTAEELEQTSVREEDGVSGDVSSEERLSCEGLQFTGSELKIYVLKRSQLNQLRQPSERPASERIASVGKRAFLRVTEAALRKHLFLFLEDLLSMSKGVQAHDTILSLLGTTYFKLLEQALATSPPRGHEWLWSSATNIINIYANSSPKILRNALMDSDATRSGLRMARNPASNRPLGPSSPTNGSAETTRSYITPAVSIAGNTLLGLLTKATVSPELDDATRQRAAEAITRIIELPMSDAPNTERQAFIDCLVLLHSGRLLEALRPLEGKHGARLSNSTGLVTSSVLPDYADPACMGPSLVPTLPSSGNPPTANQRLKTVTSSRAISPFWFKGTGPYHALELLRALQRTYPRRAMPVFRLWEVLKLLATTLDAVAPKVTRQIVTVDSTDESRREVRTYVITADAPRLKAEQARIRKERSEAETKEGAKPNQQPANGDGAAGKNSDIVRSGGYEVDMNVRYLQLPLPDANAISNVDVAFVCALLQAIRAMFISPEFGAMLADAVASSGIVPTVLHLFALNGGRDNMLSAGILEFFDAVCNRRSANLLNAIVVVYSSALDRIMNSEKMRDAGGATQRCILQLRQARASVTNVPLRNLGASAAGLYRRESYFDLASGGGSVWNSASRLGSRFKEYGEIDDFEEVFDGEDDIDEKDGGDGTGRASDEEPDLEHDRSLSLRAHNFDDMRLNNGEIADMFEDWDHEEGDSAEYRRRSRLFQPRPPISRDDDDDDDEERDFEENSQFSDQDEGFANELGSTRELAGVHPAVGHVVPGAAYSAMYPHSSEDEEDDDDDDDDDHDGDDVSTKGSHQPTLQSGGGNLTPISPSQPSHPDAGENVVPISFSLRAANSGDDGDEDDLSKIIASRMQQGRPQLRRPNAMLGPVRTGLQLNIRSSTSGSRPPTPSDSKSSDEATTNDDSRAQARDGSSGVSPSNGSSNSLANVLGLQYGGDDSE